MRSFSSAAQIRANASSRTVTVSSLRPCHESAQDAIGDGNCSRVGLSVFAGEEYGGSRHQRRDGGREKELTRIPAQGKNDAADHRADNGADAPDAKSPTDACGA
jgi:hypothetical protein